MNTIKLISIISLVSNSLMPIASFAGKIHQAARYGSVREIEEALADGENINSPMVTYSGPILPIHLAAFSNNYESVEFLVKNGAYINAITSIHGAPIHIASKMGCLEMVKLLIDNGANVNIRGISRFTPLHIAAGYGYLEIVKLLIANGAVIDDSDNVLGETPLMSAIKSVGRMPEAYFVAEFLLENGADPLKVNASNATPVVVAAMNVSDVRIFELFDKYMNKLTKQKSYSYMEPKSGNCDSKVTKNKSYCDSTFKKAASKFQSLKENATSLQNLEKPQIIRPKIIKTNLNRATLI